MFQGLDMSAVASMGNNFGQDDDLVCTPDFPLEPLCEVKKNFLSFKIDSTC